jgi:hypothetical protein
MLPRLQKAPVSTLWEGDFCGNSEECGNGFVCRPSLISKRRFASACVPEGTCFKKEGFVQTLTNTAYSFTSTYEAVGPCIKRKIVDYSVGEAGGCYNGKHCKNGLGCLPVVDPKLKRPNAICVDEAKNCELGKDKELTINKLTYKTIKDKCFAKPKLGVKLGLAAEATCTKTE